MDACGKVGFTSKKSDRIFLLAYALICFHRGYNFEDMQRVGVPPEVGVGDLELWLNGRDEFTAFGTHLIPLQRCAMVLLGLAQGVGANGLSISECWEGAARREQRGGGLERGGAK